MAWLPGLLLCPGIDVVRSQLAVKPFHRAAPFPHMHQGEGLRLQQGGQLRQAVKDGRYVHVQHFAGAPARPQAMGGQRLHPLQFGKEKSAHGW